MVVLEEEIDPLKENYTWEFVHFSKGKITIGCKWLYKRKSKVTCKSSLQESGICEV